MLSSALITTALFGCFVSAFVPVVNAEALLVGIAVASPAAALPAAVLGTIGQVAGKLVLYFVGRGAVHLPQGRLRSRVDRASAGLSKHQGGGSVMLFVSAASGLPPFFVTSIAAGVARLSVRRFLVAALAGRMLRFGTLVLLPGFAAWLLH